MSITTYDGLKASIANWLNRDDLVDTIPDFIEYAESDLNRKIRHHKMITRADAVLDTSYVQLPADWLETMRFTLIGGTTHRLASITVDDILKYTEESNNTAGRPNYYAHVGDTIEVVPTPDASYDMQLTYYAEIPKLTAANQTNWLLSSNPDIYLYAALLQSAPFLKEDARIPVWAGLYQNAQQSLQQASDATRFSVTSPRMKLTSFS